MQNPTPKGGILCFKRLVFATEIALLGLFWGVFTGFYKNAKSYVIEY